MNPKSTVPFENFGRFFVGHVQRANTSNRAGRLRIRCFVSKDGAIGASSIFSRREAYRNATEQRPFSMGDTVQHTLVNLLRARGFPVTHVDDQVDDESAATLLRELKPIQ